MSDKSDKKTKKNYFDKAAAEKAMEMAKSKITANWKVILGVFILIIVVLGFFSCMMQNKISRAMVPLKSEIAKLDARVVETEKSTIDVDVVKTDIAAIKKAGEDFHRRLNALIKAEEEKLTRLEKESESQKAYINELKNLQK